MTSHLRPLLFATLAGFFGLLSPRALHARPETASVAVLPQGVSLTQAGDFVISGDESLRHFTQSGPPDAPVWQIATLRDTSPAWAIQLIGRTTAAVAKNDVALLRFRGRVLGTLQETGQGQVRAVVQRAGGDFQRSAVARFDLSREWREFLVPVNFVGDYAAGEAAVFFGFGFPAQTVEISDVSLINYGKNVAYRDLPRTRITYEGAQPDAAWRRDALARIERIRKGDLAVYVTDAVGRPVSAASVSVEMERHHFPFGTAVPFPLLMDEGPDREPFRKAFLSIFNAATAENDLKWRFWEDNGPSGQARAVAALGWLKENKIAVRGHVFIWPAANRMPKKAVALIGTARQPEIPELIRKHIRDISAATSGMVGEWDVLNEPFSHHQLMDLFGRQIMADWFKTARAAVGPDVPLYFNDWGNHDIQGDPVHLQHFIDTARFILASGGPIDGLGLQAHIGGSPPSPATLLATLDHYQKELGLPVRVTEYDFDTDDRQLNADYTRDFLTAYFSHPLVAGIQFWGFWEKAHWRPRAALFDDAWNETPVGAATRKLLRETWWTRAEGVSGPSGHYATRGFYGDYIIRASLAGRTVESRVRHLPGTRPTAVSLVLP
jgi:GH35 family endo-1,4-beta-xylanase